MLKERPGPREVVGGIAQAGFVASQSRLRLGQACLGFARVDLEEQFALLEILPLLKVYTDDMAAHTRLHRHAVIGADMPESRKIKVKILLNRLGHQNRNRLPDIVFGGGTGILG